MPDIIVRVKTKEQLLCIPENDAICAVIVDSACASLAKEQKETYRNRRIFLQLPDILKEDKARLQEALLKEADAFDGLVVKTFDQLGLIKYFLEENGRKMEVIGDAFLYSYNPDALSFYRELFADIKWILPDELTGREIAGLTESAISRGLSSGGDFVFKVYGYQPLMVTNQCIRKNYQGCKKAAPAGIRFTDEKNNAFYAVNDCTYCYNLIYNGQPTNLLDKVQYEGERFLVGEIEFANLLIDLTMENKKETVQIMEDLDRILRKEPIVLKGNYTRGHYYKGVE